jgi:hypothetical protein
VYYFMNWSARNTTDPPSLAPTDYYNALVERFAAHGPWVNGYKSPWIVANEFYGIDIFLHQTAHRWFLSAHSDTVINFPLLPGYFRLLEAAVDPLSTFVARGNCLSGFDRKPPFPHGGAGLLYSRAACQTLWDMREYIVTHGRAGQDEYYGTLWPMLNHSMYSTTAGEFLGYDFDRWIRRRLFAGRYDSFEPCARQQERGPDGCRRFMVPLRSVVFFHSHRYTFDDYYWRNAWLVFHAPPRLMFYMEAFKPQLCMMANVTRRS